MTTTPRHVLSSLDLSSAELDELAGLALDLQAGRRQISFAGIVGAFLFFNPSVRTRLSCEAALFRFGGHGLSLHPGKDTWSFESRAGAVMDGETQEHVRELAPVVGRMCQIAGIRKSDLITRGADRPAVTQDYEWFARDEFLHSYAAASPIPVVNLESNRFHPLQGLADMALIKQRLDAPRERKYVLTWAWHPKCLPVATPHSQMLAAADLGMHVVVLRPNGYGLDPVVVAAARTRAEARGGSLVESEDVENAYRGARVVCAKSWGSLPYYGRAEEEARAKEPLRSRWIVDEAKLAWTDAAFFMHCLPVRRNVIVTDAVLDSPRSAVIDQAEQRLWTAAALFARILGRA